MALTKVQAGLLEATGTASASTFLRGDGAWAAPIASGSVVQVVSTTLPTTFSMSGASFVEITGLTATITPTSTSSKILVAVHLGRVAPNINLGGTVAVRLMRGATVIGAGTPSGSQLATSFVSTGNQNGNYVHSSQSTQFLDSPNTASATTYSVQILGESSIIVYINRSYVGGTGATTYEAASASTITLMEIAA
tara:strand:- start:367 stop:948 length:582 start_codon:yes stop_codon:yes gene_type:complete